MGSQPQNIQEIHLAYIAGFLDGDGSIMLQIKRRKDTTLGWRVMCTICFYQDSRHDQPLYWIQRQLGIGYISKRNDGMTELRINGYNQCGNILRRLQRFIQFKTVQTNAILKAIDILSQKKRTKDLSFKEREQVRDCILKIQSQNYQSKAKKSVEVLNHMFGLTP